MELDLAKSIFQVHGVDATGQVVVRKSLRPEVASTISDAAIFRQVAFVPGRHRGMQHLASPGARADQARPSGTLDAAGLRQAVCEAREPTLPMRKRFAKR